MSIVLAPLRPRVVLGTADLACAGSRLLLGAAISANIPVSSIPLSFAAPAHQDASSRFAPLIQFDLSQDVVRSGVCVPRS
jgi:hypothetical protein